jgi:DNA invertase Pin-like site-specific DNA recombinase
VTAGTKVVGYTRVSTTDQGDSGLGLQAQREAIQAECARRGWELVRFEEDVLSGSTMNRPGLSRALAACRSGEVAGVVVAKLDRVSRSLIDFVNLIAEATRDGWNVVALDLGVDLSTPTGEFFGTVLAAMAQWERRLIGQRTREALAQARANGVVLGRPSGVSDELRTRILRMREGREHPGFRTARMTYQAIADKLNAEGVPTAQGGERWHPSTVASILKAERVPA